MEIKVNNNNSIRLASNGKVIYFDPYKIDSECHDADIIFVTHDHGDHFSIEDIAKIEKDDTVYVIPDCMYNLLGGENVITVESDRFYDIEGLKCEVYPAYNQTSAFHPKDKAYVSYVLIIDDERIYVAGDCDRNEDNIRINCDIAFVPIGGRFTFDYKEAADFINTIKPKKVIPTHYGSVAGDKEDGLRFKELVNKDIEVEILL